MKGYLAHVVARAHSAPLGARAVRYAFERVAEVDAALPAAPAPARALSLPSPRGERAGTALRLHAAPAPDPVREVVRLVERSTPPAARASAPPARSTPAPPAEVVASRTRPAEAASSRAERASAAAAQEPAPAPVSRRIERAPSRAPSRAVDAAARERTIVEERTIVVDREVEAVAAASAVEEPARCAQRAAASPTIRVVVPADARGLGGDVTGAIERAAREATRRRLGALGDVERRTLDVRIERVDVHLPAAPAAAPPPASAPATASGVLARSLSRF